MNGVGRRASEDDMAGTLARSTAWRSFQWQTIFDPPFAGPPPQVETEPVLRPGQRTVFLLLLLAMAGANVIFWSWWLAPQHVGTLWMYIVFTLAFGYDATFLPLMYLFFVGRMRRPREMPAPPGLRVALITLCVPSSESLDIIRRQLEALVRVRYAHDSWVLDEGNDPAVRAMAERLGVKHFSRAGIARYNQPRAPFKARTKAGNVNAWLDLHGGEYDYFVQLDVDHIPKPEYLDKVLGYFRDPKVGWVQAPSLYGNLDNWISRGAAEQELILQGPLQMGFFGSSRTPFIIGSHTAYRMSAVLEMNGFQPTRAEDHLDTLVLSGSGYEGVFIPEVLALGNGPETFETYLRQHFAWASSLMEVLIFHAFRWVRHMSPSQALQFLFTESWYPLWSTSLLVMFSIPPVALLSLQRPANASLLVFIAHWLPLGAVSTAAWLWTKPWQMPRNIKLSWRGVVLHVARWPIVFWALVNVLLGVKHSYMITRKGADKAVYRFSFRSQWIYLLGVWSTVLAIWAYLLVGQVVVPRQSAADAWAHYQSQGYTLLALWGALFLLLVYAVNVAADFRVLHRLGVRLSRLFGLRALPAGILLVTLATFVLTANESLHSLQGSLGVKVPGQALLPYLFSPPPQSAAAAQPRAAEPAALSPTSLISQLTQPETLPPSAPAPTAVTLHPPASLVDLPSGQVVLGDYDPSGALSSVDLPLVHRYIEAADNSQLIQAVNSTPSGSSLMLTVEPVPIDQTSPPALETIVGGKKDDELRKMARTVASLKPRVILIRWGHEMEMSGLYPWAANNPALYKAAYRRVTGIFYQEGASNVRWVWSPAGNPGAEAYYPGPDVVDYIGVTVLGDPNWDKVLLNLPPQSFAELLKPKYDLLSRFNKPIIVAELGVSGDAARQQEWLIQAARDVQLFPLVRALSYYDDINIPNNVTGTLPDWRITSSTLRQFNSALNNSQIA